MDGRKKHLLIVMVGTSPAVITETVYALCQEKKEPPDKVIVYTTSTGKKKIIQELFSSAGSIWSQMLDQMNLTGKIEFGPASIEEIRIARNGITEFCNDITSDEENNAMADFLLQEIRSYTDNPDWKISLSIAGGRKSMSAMGALVMSLISRRGDKLYHILVEEGFENPKLSPPFFYPKKGDEYPEQNKQSIDVKLSLMEIPIVHCRYWFQDKYRDIPDYTSLVNRINEEQLEIRLDFNDYTIWFCNKQIKTNFLQFQLYRMFVALHKEEDHWLYYEQPTLEDLADHFQERLKDWGIELEEEASEQVQGYAPKNKIKKSNLEIGALRRNISKLSRKLEEADERLKISQGQSSWRIDLNIPSDNIKEINNKEGGQK